MKEYKFMKGKSRQWVLPDVLFWFYAHKFAVLLLEMLDDNFVKTAKRKNVLFTEFVDQVHNKSYFTNINY